jgi:TM2 domain-containing membrane protein YozV/predicted Ser/Thr protein kinase
MDTEKICPNCRKPLPPDVPLGLCPECLIKSGFPTESGAGSAGEAAERFVPPPTEEIARLFPQLEILGLIGKGGMGAVYKARQPSLDRFVALKVLPPALANDPGFAERFNREARALARLSHPNIVAVYDFGKAGALHYVLMEFIDGTNLREVERSRCLTPEQAVAIVPQICEALQFAHNEGIVHRDIKPENLLLDKKGRLKITDFGIAKMVGVSASTQSLTGAKDVVGTPLYMAPGQIEKPLTVDHRADIYSLGVVFYEMLTGELPLGKFAPPSRKVEVDVRLDEVVLHALEKEPSQRYQHASQVKTDVETITRTPPVAPGPASAPQPFSSISTAATSDKAILPAFLLAFFFGIFGAHRFYVGKIWTALLQAGALAGCGGLIWLIAIAEGDWEPGLGLALTGLICACGIWATVDWILLVCKAFRDGKGKRMTRWLHSVNGGAVGGVGPTDSPTAFKQNTPVIVPRRNPPGAGGAWKIALAIGLFLVVALVAGVAYSAIRIANIVKQGNALANAQGPETDKPIDLSFPLTADGCFNIDDVNGRIEITGWDRNEVSIKGNIHASSPEDAEAVKIDVDNNPDEVTVHTRLPPQSEEFLLSLFSLGRRGGQKVDYKVQVPNRAKLGSVNNVNGPIEVAGISGSIHATTVNDVMHIKDAASDLNLSSVNGRISVELASLGQGQTIELNGVNGPIEATIPDNASASFSINSLNGGLTSEFPALEVKKEFPVGSNLKGALGDGGASVKASSVNGGISIRKAPPAQKPTLEQPEKGNQ